jgi:hypothetical protein
MNSSHITHLKEKQITKTNHKNIEQPAPSHGLNDVAPNCHTKIVTTTSLYFKEERNFIIALCIANYRV